MRGDKRLSDFWTQTLSCTLGTVIGIVVTFGTTATLQRCERQQMEHTAALMVVHNIDNFCRSMEADLDALVHTDSLYSVVWEHVPNRLDKLADDTLQLFIESLLSRDFTVIDHTAENIFSTNIDTWKSIGSSEFVEVAGKCFSVKQKLEQLQQEMNERKRRVYDTIMTTTLYTEQPAKSAREAAARVFRSAELCTFISWQHNVYLNVMQAGLAALREQNANCKRLMHVSDEELATFGDNNELKTYEYSNK